MEIIITDLTRFSNPDIVCIAGINTETNECIRPLHIHSPHYIALSDCRELNILPGAKLEGDFVNNNNRGAPHVEDRSHAGLKFNGACTADEFHQVLEHTTTTSIAAGFGYLFPEGGKVIPHTNPPQKSIITLKVQPSQIRIVKDSFNNGKIKLNLMDNDDRRFSYLPITDLGFYSYAMQHFNNVDFPERINRFIDEHKELYLRVGLSGRYTSNDRDGYWLQINGIYTFPNFDTEIRSYS